MMTEFRTWVVCVPVLCVCLIGKQKKPILRLFKVTVTVTEPSVCVECFSHGAECVFLQVCFMSP
jgi:hypothetical protein